MITLRRFFKSLYELMKAAVRGFSRDECYIKASALTFYSLLSIVPSLAIAFGIAKGFGFQETLELEFRQVLKEQKEVANYLIYFVYHLLDEVKGNLLTGIGVITLLWTTLKLLESIEHALNDIWKIQKPRSYVRKFADYFATLFFSLFFIVAASSATVFISSQLHSYAAEYTTFRPLYSTFLIFLPIVLSWGLFTFVYLFMPNTRVPFFSALIAGIIAGTIYQITQFIYIKFQIGVASYGAIYGSFAALPLFLVWLQTSWVIVLFGGELAYYFDKYAPIFKYREKLVEANESTLAVMTMIQAVKTFYAHTLLTIPTLSRDLEVTLDIATGILSKLQDAGLLVAVEGDNTKGYQPAIPLEELTVHTVLKSFLKVDERITQIKDSKELAHVSKIISDFEALEENSPSNALLKDISN